MVQIVLAAETFAAAIVMRDKLLGQLPSLTFTLTLSISYYSFWCLPWAIFNVECLVLVITEPRAGSQAPGAAKPSTWRPKWASESP